MAIDENELAGLLADCRGCSGRTVTRFLCPILLEETDTIELIVGHILPQALQDASKATVIQRGDVDNFYGHTVEHVLVEFLNSVKFTKAE